VILTFFRNILGLFALIPTVCVFLWCTPTPGICLEKHTVTGRTMGTTYSVTVMGDNTVDKPLLKQKIDARLAGVNQSMSIFLPLSEISLFNAIPAHTPFTVSPDFAKVMEQGSRIYTLTNGAWDGTIRPLVDLWGFGTESALKSLPDPRLIKKLLAQTGFHFIEVQGNVLSKQIDAVTLDLGSLAKGYGVDAVGQLMEESGFKAFLVEIGGEVVARGTKPFNKEWTVGISRPEPGSSEISLYRSIKLKDRALATSGDYRNFIFINDQKFSHIIDPATGYPVKTNVVSASVIADTCTFADGLATALMVMEPAQSLALVNELDNVECLIVVRNKDGSFQTLSSNRFP